MEDWKLEMGHQWGYEEYEIIGRLEVESLNTEIKTGFSKVAHSLGVKKSRQWRNPNEECMQKFYVGKQENHLTTQLKYIIGKITMHVIKKRAWDSEERILRG